MKLKKVTLEEFIPIWIKDPYTKRELYAKEIAKYRINVCKCVIYIRHAYLTSNNEIPLIIVDRKTKEAIVNLNRFWKESTYINGYTIYKCSWSLHYVFRKWAHNKQVNTSIENRYPRSMIKLQVLFNMCHAIVNNNYNRSRYVMGIKKSINYAKSTTIKTLIHKNHTIIHIEVQPRDLLEKVNRYLRMTSYKYSIYMPSQAYATGTHFCTDTLYNIITNHNCIDDDKTRHLNITNRLIWDLEYGFVVYRADKREYFMNTMHNNFYGAINGINRIAKLDVKGHIDVGSNIERCDPNILATLNKIIWDRSLLVDDLSFMDNVYAHRNPKMIIHNYTPPTINYNLLNAIVTKCISNIDTINKLGIPIQKGIYPLMFKSYRITSTYYVDVTNLIEHNGTVYMAFNNYFIIDIYKLRDILNTQFKLDPITPDVEDLVNARFNLDLNLNTNIK